jgi:hypothetical protein
MAELTVFVVVTGRPTMLSAEPNTTIGDVCLKAITLIYGEDGGVGDWEVRDRIGELLHPDDAVESATEGSEARLFVNLRPGIGG